MPQFPNEYDEKFAADLDGNDEILIDVAGTSYIKTQELKKFMSVIDVEEVAGTTYTLLTTDQGKEKRFTNSGAKTLTIPPTAGFILSSPVLVTNRSSSDITFAGDTGVSLNSQSASIAPNESRVFRPHSTNVWDVYGGGTTGDISAPVVVTVEATDANTIDVTFNEDITGDVGFSFSTVGVLTVNSVTPVGSNVLRFDIDETMTSLDDIGWDYTPGDIEDTAGNAMVADSGTVTNSIPAPSYDSDAQAVIDAIELTDSGPLSTPEKDAINDRIVALKDMGKWTNMVAYYGYGGTTANSHAINWKSPGTFNITWIGGVAHDADGVTFNGTTGCGNTGLNDNTVLTLDDVTMGGYSRTSSNNGFMMGVRETGVASLYIADRSTDGFIGTAHDNTGLTAAMTPTRTIIIARQTAAPKLALYRDGTQLAVDSASAVTKLNGNIHLGAIYNLFSLAVEGFSDKNYASHFIYNGGFTAAEVTQFTSDENVFQTALGRNV